MKTTIKTTDFSSSTLELFNTAKETKSFVGAFAFARLLIAKGFTESDVKQFMKANFKTTINF